MKSFSALFQWPKNLRAPRPPPTLIIFPKSPDQNSEITILLNVVKNLITMSLGPTYSPTVPVGGATSYKLWLLLTYSNGYLEVYRRFQGDFLVSWEAGCKEGDMLWELSLEEFIMGEENFYEGSAGFSSIIKKKLKKNMKSFFNCKQGAELKPLKTNRDYYAYDGLTSS